MKVGDLNNKLSYQLKPAVLAALELGAGSSNDLFTIVKETTPPSVCTVKRVVAALVELEIEGKVLSRGIRGKAKMWCLQERTAK